jgi:hypothetical protein
MSKCKCSQSDLTPTECYEAAAEVLRRKDYPVPSYGGTSVSTVTLITHTEAAKTWIQLGDALKGLEEASK